MCRRTVPALSMSRKEQKKRRMYNLPTFVWHLSAIDHSVGHFVTLIRMSSESTRQWHTLLKFDDNSRTSYWKCVGHCLIVTAQWFLVRTPYSYARGLQISQAIATPKDDNETKSSLDVNRAAGTWHYERYTFPFSYKILIYSSTVQEVVWNKTIVPL